MKKILSTLVLFSLLVMQAKAQKLPEIDLAKTQKGDELSIDADCSGFKIVNKLPGFDYQINISVSETPLAVPPATVSNGSSLSSTCTDKMKDYMMAYNKLVNLTDESGVKDAITALNAAKDLAAKDPETKICYDNSDVKAEGVIAKTVETRSFDFTVKKGQTISVTINRLKSDGKTVMKTWSVIFKTPNRVDYISHFGFTFSPGIIKRPKQYFAKAGDDGKYTITEMNHNGSNFWNDLSLTANFIFPIGYQKHPDAPLHLAWMGGFGINGDTKFTVFTGPSILLSDFISLGLGFGVSTQYQLNGQYKAGDVIKDNLTFEQLHSKGLKGDMLITIGFRLSKTQLQAKDAATDK